ncbi:MAG TPA: FAD-binding oxidoreductase, partial [Thermomicrobiales bacterium]|nr:FAD-binding oxidoreductase [Thermomicrobiales bacterium]
MAVETSDIRHEQLAASIRGTVVLPGDDAYAEARRVYNRMIDRHPAMIVECADAADVITALHFARDAGWPISVRAGGHSVPGFSTNDDGMVIDLAPMRNVHIDPARKVATVGGGATWGDVDHAAWSFGLVTPGGVVSTTGVTGLGLGGGFGHLTRRFGLVVDNMLGADVVTADGELVYTSERENPDLFWAIRGGGGNFGIVTRLELALHPVPGMYGGPIFYPVSAVTEVLPFYVDFIDHAPRELSAFFAFVVAPSAPFVPEVLWGHTACAIVVSWSGDPSGA